MGPRYLRYSTIATASFKTDSPKTRLKRVLSTFNSSNVAIVATGSIALLKAKGALVESKWPNPGHRQDDT
eukprot:scaffold339_cov402-Prasinococcus_capsulatus_cf.AAC.5